MRVNTERSLTVWNSIGKSCVVVLALCLLQLMIVRDLLAIFHNDVDEALLPFDKRTYYMADKNPKSSTVAANGWLAPNCANLIQ